MSARQQINARKIIIVVQRLNRTRIESDCMNTDICFTIYIRIYHYINRYIEIY